ncbi:MAG TPA: UDP-N-acetylmuramoyl-tripeptide--D-alanyl-D-alanine ligase [Polyangiaceae bacterium]|nr:UDP-N-acetylmuramoyl-tripeptide--D-alanyl-D-alanine ligase [Polyangiaceae bacterium]
MATAIPKNRAPFTTAEILLAADGHILREGAASRHVGVSTDSRSVEAGEVFVALVGERFDGHAHAHAAAERGASAVVVSREVEVPPGVAVIRVADTERALGLLGRAHRRRWGASAFGVPRPVIGITGSAGKTSTRHAIATLLAGLGVDGVLSSKGNLNNAVGVPMTLLGLTAEHRAAVVEIGMNRPGEIAWASSLAEPVLGVLTLVAAAHTEGVGSIWGVMKEKSDLLAALPERGTAIVNADDELARAALVTTRAETHITYGEAPDATVRLASRRPLGLAGAEISLTVARDGAEPAVIEAMLPMLGRAGTYAALAAIATAVAIDSDILDHPGGLAGAIGSLGAAESGRLAPRQKDDGTIVIDDAYNANPASMRASIDAAREIADGLERPLVLILGEMRELGAGSDALHEEVGAHAARAKPRVVVVVGSPALAAGAAAAGAEVIRVDDATAALAAAAAALRPRDVVLVKASNSLGLSPVAARL